LSRRIFGVTADAGMRTKGFVASVAIALALSGCGGGTEEEVVAAAPAGTLQLKSNAMRVSEGSGAASVLVTRTGGSFGAVSATLSIVPGSAGIGPDVTATTKTVVFADGDAATKTVTIPILDDGEDEADETFTAQLSTVSGGAALGSLTSATITIADDDDASILTHRVAGTVSGLSGTVALRNNDADELRIDANGAFTFPVQVAEGQRYAVTVATQPAGQDCTVAHASGTMGTTDVIDVAVTCVGGAPPPPPPPTTGVFTGGPVGGLHYRTPTHSGLTDAAGTFAYVPGERVAFSIGAIELGSALDAAQVNLFALVGTTPPSTELALRTEINSPNNLTDFDRVANRAHLLFALDVDHNSANGIDLGDWDTQLADAALNFELPMKRFVADEFARFAGIHGILYKFSPELPMVHLYRSLGITVSAHTITGVTTTLPGFRQIFQLDSDGRLIRDVFEFDNNRDGTVDSRNANTTNYDATGNVISKVQESDNDADGMPDSRSTTTTNYDVEGNLVLNVIATDSVADGTPNDILTTTYTYDVAGNRLVSLTEDDFNADGIVDRKTSNAYAYTYDVAGRVLTRKFEDDIGADGSVNQKIVNAFVYDAAGNLLSDREEYDQAGSVVDGKIDFVKMTTYVRDSVGKESSLSTEFDSNADGIIESRSSNSFTYDSAGNVVFDLYEYDAKADDTIDSKEARTITFDAAGSILAIRRDVDNNGDDVAEDVLVESKVYGVDGNVQSLVVAATQAPTTEYTFGSAILADGLGYLLRGESIFLGLD
jgi:hypothetical protein